MQSRPSKADESLVHGGLLLGPPRGLASNDPEHDSRPVCHEGALDLPDHDKYNAQPA